VKAYQRRGYVLARRRLGHLPKTRNDLVIDLDRLLQAIKLREVGGLLKGRARRGA